MNWYKKLREAPLKWHLRQKSKENEGVSHVDTRRRIAPWNDSKCKGPGTESAWHISGKSRKAGLLEQCWEGKVGGY